LKCAQYNDGYQETDLAFANNINTHEATHLIGFIGIDSHGQQSPSPQPVQGSEGELSGDECVKACLRHRVKLPNHSLKVRRRPSSATAK